MSENRSMVLHCKVRGQGRPKFGKGHAYEKREDTEYKEMLRAAWVEQTGGYSFGCSPVEVHIVIERQLPKSRAKSVVREADVYKPDVDNCCKATLDALNGVAFDDDRQVVEVLVRKCDRRRHEDGLDILRVTVFEA